MGWAELRRAIADDKSNTANWSDESTSVEVTQQKGFMCNVKAKGKLHMEPDKVFDILVAPDNHKYFSGIKRIEYRKVLEDDKAGKMKVEVQQVGQWKFLGFSGEFSTTLYVHQDRKAGKIRFQLAKPGLMKDFAGTWTIQPLTPKDLHPAPAPDSASQGKRQGGGGPGFLSMLPFQKARGSFVTLEQSILPGFVPPKPLDRVLKGISAKQVQIILQDLRQEVERQSSAENNGKIPAVKAATRLQEDAEPQRPARRRQPPSAFGTVGMSIF
ncbi:hypothetical protein ABBQ32_012300 [Trebouxia sp. C0010 RCD-2024]